MSLTLSDFRMLLKAADVHTAHRRRARRRRLRARWRWQWRSWTGWEAAGLAEAGSEEEVAGSVEVAVAELGWEAAALEEGLLPLPELVPPLGRPTPARGAVSRLERGSVGGPYPRTVSPGEGVSEPVR